MFPLFTAETFDSGKFNLMDTLARIIIWLTSTGLRILIIVIGAAILIRLLTRVSSRLIGRLKKDKDIEAVKRIDTIESVVRFIIIFVMASMGSLMVLSALEIDIAPLLATAGIAGVAIGFGSQQLVQDVISGFFILMEDQIRVGDVVEIAGKSGLVERINLRMTVLRDLAGNVHFVRNGMIDVITNMTKEYSYSVYEIRVAYREDVDRVIEVIREVDAGLRKESDIGQYILEPIEVLGLDQFADSALVIKARTKTVPSQQWTVARAFNGLLKKRFDEAGIEIPFPRQTIYIGKEAGEFARSTGARGEKTESDASSSTPGQSG